MLVLPLMNKPQRMQAKEVRIMRSKPASVLFTLVLIAVAGCAANNSGSTSEDPTVSPTVASSSSASPSASSPTPASSTSSASAVASTPAPTKTTQEPIQPATTEPVQTPAVQESVQPIPTNTVQTPTVVVDSTESARIYLHEQEFNNNPDVVLVPLRETPDQMGGTDCRFRTYSKSIDSATIGRQHNPPNEQASPPKHHYLRRFPYLPIRHSSLVLSSQLGNPLPLFYELQALTRRAIGADLE